MKSNHKCEKELNQLKEVKAQRDFYKDKYEKLKKLVDRLGEDYPDNKKVKAITMHVESHKQSDLKAKLSEKWRCHSCEKGTLKIIKVPHAGHLGYFRKCDNLKCTKKTRLKPYSQEVEVS